MQPAPIPIDRKFESVWKGLNGVEQEASYQLEYKTLDSAIEGLVKHFGKELKFFIGDIKRNVRL